MVPKFSSKYPILGNTHNPASLQLLEISIFEIARRYIVRFLTILYMALFQKKKFFNHCDPSLDSWDVSQKGFWTVGFFFLDEGQKLSYPHPSKKQPQKLANSPRKESSAREIKSLLDWWNLTGDHLVEKKLVNNFVATHQRCSTNSRQFSR